MEKKEIQLGNVTYQLSRTFVGSKSVSDLVIEAVVERTRGEGFVGGKEGATA